MAQADTSKYNRITAPITWTRGGENWDRYCQFHYYDERANMWKYLPKLQTLQHSPTMIVVDGTLFAAGGLAELMGGPGDDSDSDDYDDSDDEGNRYYTRSMDSFFCFDAEHNGWKRLPSMKTARSDLLLVNLDRCIYAIGSATHDDEWISDVEGFNLDKKKWKRLASLPGGFQWVSAVVFEGKILVYGVSKSTRSVPGDYKSPYICEHVIQVYDPSTNIWQSVLSEKQESSGDCIRSYAIITPPLLFIHNGICYRVQHRKPVQLQKRYYGGPFHPQDPSVNILKVEPHEDNICTITVKETVKQDLIPSNIVGAFRIEDEVFLNVRGFVYKTNVKIGDDQQTYVEMKKWERLTASGDTFDHVVPREVVWFTFDLPLTKRK